MFFLCLQWCLLYCSLLRRVIHWVFSQKSSDFYLILNILLSLLLLSLVFSQADASFFHPPWGCLPIYSLSLSSLAGLDLLMGHLEPGVPASPFCCSFFHLTHPVDFSTLDRYYLEKILRTTQLMDAIANLWPKLKKDLNKWGNVCVYGSKDCCYIDLLHPHQNPLCRRE